VVYRRAILPFFYFADLTASNSNSFRRGQFSSQGLIKPADILCPEKVQELENTNFSRNRATEPIRNTASDLRCKLRSSSKIVPAHSRAVDESRDVNYCSVWQCLFAVETKILLQLRNSWNYSYSGNYYFRITFLSHRQFTIKSIKFSLTYYTVLCEWRSFTHDIKKGSEGSINETLCSNLHSFHCTVHQEALCGEIIRQEHT